MTGDFKEQFTAAVERLQELGAVDALNTIIELGEAYLAGDHDRAAEIEADIKEQYAAFQALGPKRGQL